jgi:hypothetical protein
MMAVLGSSSLLVWRLSMLLSLVVEAVADATHQILPLGAVAEVGIFLMFLVRTLGVA